MLLYKDIIKDDNPILRNKSKHISLPPDKSDIDTIKSLNEYLVNSYDDEMVQKYDLRPGIGLAAPQIGVLKNMFVLLLKDENNNVFNLGVINPKIISHSEEKTFLPEGEGCLSVDRTIEGFVHRYKRIKAKVHLYDFNTDIVKEETLKIENFLAIVFQHEYDHLSGILFYDHIDKNNPYYIPDNSQPLKIALENEEK